jgi:hypothetical protein
VTNNNLVIISTILFAFLLAVGSAIGVGFFLNAPPQSSKSDRPDIARSHFGFDQADSIVHRRRQLGVETGTRSVERNRTTEAPSVPAVALPKVQQDAFETSRRGEMIGPAGQEDTGETAGSDLRVTALPNVQHRTVAPSKRSKVVGRRSEPCRNDACRRALAECTQLCDAAMSMAVAACPRVSAGASPDEEKTCLAKRDRSRRNCHSGCTLKMSDAVK